MTRRAYDGTKVSVEKSQSEAREILRKRGIAHVQWTEEPDPQTARPMHTLRFRVLTAGKVQHELRVRMTVRTPAPGMKARETNNQRAARIEQEERRVMRVFVHHLKTLFEASDVGLQRVEELFLAHLEDATGCTVGEALRPLIPRLSQSTLPRAALTAGGPS